MGKTKRNSRRKKNEETKRRYEAIKDMMSTFAMSTIAVVAAVTLIPASPKAEITKAVSLSEEIIYQVQVTDEDNALDLDTLFIVLENQLEYYEQPIELGEQSGYFMDLEQETEYRLSVYGNKGFGQERLDSVLVTTRQKIGGSILSVTPEQLDYTTNYFVDVSVYDPDAKYSSITMYYGYSNEHEPDIIYTEIPITQTRMSIELNDIFTVHPFHIYLEGQTEDGPEILDEIWVTPPFRLYASVYLEYVNNENIGYHLYPDMHVENIQYIMNVYKDQNLIKTIPIENEDNNYEGMSFVIDNLTPETTYNIECVAIFTNPQTLRKETLSIYEQEIITVPDYSYTYTIEPIGEYYEISIILDDPGGNFQNAFYAVYDTSGDHDMYIDGNVYYFIEEANETFVTFSFFIPTTTSYEVIIGIRNELNANIKEIIDTFSN